MMRSPLLTRGNGLFVAVVLFLFCIVLFIGCRRTEVLSRKPPFTVKDGKEWWYGVYRKTASYTQVDKSSVFTAPENASEKKYPSWKRAVAYKMGDLDVIEAPLVYETKRVLMPGMADIANTEEGNRIFKASNSKVLLFKKDDGTIEVRISALVPSKEYARKKFYDLSDIHLNNIPDDFDGYQMIRKWNEEQINTYTVQKGKLRAKQKLKKLGKGNFSLTSDRKLILKESIMAKVASEIKPTTVQRSVKSTDKVSTVPNTIAQYIEECRLVWVPRKVEVCIIVHEEDEPAEEVCETYESETEGDYETKCEEVWIPDEDPEDPCTTYGINCPDPNGGENTPENPDPNEDPCAEKRKRDSIAGALLKKDGIKEALDTVDNDVATNPLERSFSFGRDASGNYRATPIHSGANTYSLMQVNSPDFTIYGGFHTHNSDGYSAFSVGDLYALYEANSSNTNFEYMVELAYNNDLYAVTITNKTAFTAFFSTYTKADNYDSVAESWVTNSPVGADYDYAYQNLREQHYSPNKAHEGAMAYVMEKYNMGITLSKADSNGDFDPVNYKASGTNGITITPHDPCATQ